jgi:hypothetical protein
LAGSTEWINSGFGGECDNTYDQCSSASRFCHGLTAEQMPVIHNKIS